MLLCWVLFCCVAVLGPVVLCGWVVWCCRVVLCCVVLCWGTVVHTVRGPLALRTLTLEPWMSHSWCSQSHTELLRGSDPVLKVLLETSSRRTPNQDWAQRPAAAAVGTAPRRPVGRVLVLTRPGTLLSNRRTLSGSRGVLPSCRFELGQIGAFEGGGTLTRT